MNNNNNVFSEFNDELTHRDLPQRVRRVKRQRALRELGEPGNGGDGGRGKRRKIWNKEFSILKKLFVRTINHAYKIYRQSMHASFKVIIEYYREIILLFIKRLNNHSPLLIILTHHCWELISNCLTRSSAASF